MAGEARHSTDPEALFSASCVWSFVSSAKACGFITRMHCDSHALLKNAKQQCTFANIDGGFNQDRKVVVSDTHQHGCRKSVYARRM